MPSMSAPTTGTFEITNFRNATNFKHAEIYLQTNNQTRFFLYCFPQDSANRFSQKYTLIYLYLYLCPKGQVTVRHRISILDAKGNKCNTFDGVETLNVNNNRNGTIFQMKHDYLTDPANGYLLDGKLTIYYEIEEVDPNNPNLASTNVVIPELSNNPVLEDYESLLQGGKFSDATLFVGEKKLLVHKAILCARSKVFCAMFENDCEEKRQNRVEITDIPVEVLEQMLRYIYTGKMPEMNEFGADLFIAADKYQLEYLKSCCERHLSSTLSIESVSGTLLIADMHHAQELKSKCIEYVIEHLDAVMRTDGWKALMNTKENKDAHVHSIARLELTLELLAKIAINK